MSTKQKMNEHLRFSWGHILAFLAIIIVSYTTFSGTTYMTGGDFWQAAIVTGITDIVLLVVFIGAQTMKATSVKFRKCIWIERILVFLSPFIFFAAMIPHSHFWTVHEQEGNIVSTFKQAINNSKQMFTDYEVYSHVRIKAYDNTLDKITLSDNGMNFGFSKGKKKLQKQNMVKTLQLQLLSVNYDTMKTSAIKWIDSADNKATTWNPFLIGNLEQIKNAIHGWNEQLVEFSTKKMSNEESAGLSVQTFEGSSESLDALDNELDTLNNMFSNRKTPRMSAVITSVIIYIILLFPYALQDRHTKSRVKLLFSKRKHNRKETASEDAMEEADSPLDDDYSPFVLR